MSLSLTTMGFHSCASRYNQCVHGGQTWSDQQDDVLVSGGSDGNTGPCHVIAMTTTSCLWTLRSTVCLAKHAVAQVAQLLSASSKKRSNRDQPSIQCHSTTVLMALLLLQVRVMPKCWYVLLRFFLRVDKVLVKLRETRIFCPFLDKTAPGPIIREVKFSEGAFEELSKAGAPADGVGMLHIHISTLQLHRCYAVSFISCLQGRCALLTALCMDWYGTHRLNFDMQ